MLRFRQILLFTIVSIQQMSSVERYTVQGDELWVKGTCAGGCWSLNGRSRYAMASGRTREAYPIRWEPLRDFIPRWTRPSAEVFFTTSFAPPCFPADPSDQPSKANRGGVVIDLLMVTTRDPVTFGPAVIRDSVSCESTAKIMAGVLCSKCSCVVLDLLYFCVSGSRQSCMMSVP